MYFWNKQRGSEMSDNKRYFVVTEKAVPEVLLKVVEAKKLLESKRTVTVQEAVEAVGISRSPFINTKMISFLFVKKPKDRILHLFFRWMMNQDCSQVY